MRVRKMLIFIARSIFLYDWMSLSWCQINLIDVNFQLQKSLENFDKNSADKITFLWRLEAKWKSVWDEATFEKF